MSCFTRHQCSLLLAKAGLVALFAVACTPAHSVYIPRDPELLREPLYFYPAVPRSSHPKAGVFFLGNDLGFWEAHQKLAERLASHGYAVVGFDVKKFLDRLPDSALLRGASDKERTSDAAFIAAGGNRMTYTVIPFASHSLRSLIIAGPMIEHELDEMIVGGAVSAGAARQKP